ncbi:RAD protein (Pv-fam-e) [Plasmodium ovale wallikeri]|uniref:RAD protein (Pv-fam-e) n=1 Tax=Plasmodium ovale wallikeri TaxID=864142 RepID=A0A1A8YSY6_PLAOA|nr:RAD protein (Pv-fam-e) [Plasmodium ovale wallikeri]SBT34542.1 RAD protein (Pv-fam-e) [Plasmodium ovale wallikeri]
MWKINISNIISNDASSELRLGCRSPRLLAQKTLNVKEFPIQSYMKQKGNGSFFPFFAGIPLYKFLNSKQPTSLSINDVLDITKYFFWFITEKEKCYLLYRYSNHTRKNYDDMMCKLAYHCRHLEYSYNLPKNILNKSLEVCKHGLMKDFEGMEKCANKYITDYIKTSKCSCSSFEEFVMSLDNT